MYGKRAFAREPIYQSEMDGGIGACVLKRAQYEVQDDVAGTAGYKSQMPEKILTPCLTVVELHSPFLQCAASLVTSVKSLHRSNQFGGTRVI